MMQCHELARWRFRLVYRLTRHDHETAPTEIVVGAVDDNLVPRDRRCRGYIRQRERFGLCVDRHLPQVAQVLWLIDGAIQQQAGHFQAQAIIRVRHLLHLRDERELWLASRLLNDHPGILQYLAIHPVEIDSLAILRCKRPIRPVALTVGQCFPFCVVPSKNTCVCCALASTCTLCTRCSAWYCTVLSTIRMASPVLRLSAVPCNSISCVEG